jgi:hypothetical protein
MTMEPFPDQVKFVEKFQEGIKLLKEKGNLSMVVKIVVEYPRPTKQNLGPQYSDLTISIKSFLKKLQEEERLDFFVLASGRRVAKKLVSHEKFGSFDSATGAVDPKTIDSEYLIIVYNYDNCEKDLDLYLKLNKKILLITTEFTKQE